MVLVASLIILHLLSVECFRKPHSEVRFVSDGDSDPGSPLFLTPYIESGKIDEARELARVRLPGFPNLKSYAGFFTVDKTYDSNQFVWYFPAELKEIGTLVWLQGGPRYSSLFGLFEENGPLTVRNGTLWQNWPHWGQLLNLVYIDNPVGAGFSFTNDSRGYATNQTQIGEQLYSTLYQLYQIFPELLNFPLIVSGESYGAKYATSLAFTIDKKNSVAKAQGKSALPLKGITIGNGWCDPINQLDYGEFLYQIGLLDWNHREQVDGLANITRELIKKEAWGNATHAWKELISFINMNTGNLPMYNYVHPSFAISECFYCELLNDEQIRRAIHVGGLDFKNFDSESHSFLMDDFMKSVAPWISELIENYHVLTYNGQQDILVAYTLTTNFLRQLNWSGSQEYKTALRQSVFICNDYPTFHNEQVGFLKIAGKGNLWEALIRRAGHMVPSDQIIWSKTLIEAWIANMNSEFATVDRDQDIFYIRL